MHHKRTIYFQIKCKSFFASYAKNEGFNRSQAPIDSVRDALKIGAETERVTINYYVNLLEFANDKVKEVLDRIIKEEEKHLERLEALI